MDYEPVPELKVDKKIINMAVICQQSYEHTIGNSDYYDNLQTQTEVYLKQLDSQTLLIVFRGTDEEEDWKYNLNAIPTCLLEQRNDVWGKIRVHQGFYRKFRSVKEHIVRKIDNMLSGFPMYSKTSLRVIITGHSLGGALSMLCAVAVKMEYDYLMVETYTFGAPRVGNSSFANALNILVPEHVLVVNENDPACSVPSRIMYKHPKNMLYIGNQEKSKLETCAAGMSHVCCWMPKMTFDHSLSSYLANLKK